MNGLLFPVLDFGDAKPRDEPVWSFRTGSPSIHESQGTVLNNTSDLASYLVDRDGIDIIRGIKEGVVPLPPFLRHMEPELIEVSAGLVRIAATPTRDHLTLTGAAHGGWALSLLDSAMGFAALTTLKVGSVCVTWETSARLLRAIKPENRGVVITGKVEYQGRVPIEVSGRVEHNGQLLAIGNSSCLTVPLRG